MKFLLASLVVIIAMSQSSSAQDLPCESVKCYYCGQADVQRKCAVYCTDVCGVPGLLPDIAPLRTRVRSDSSSSGSGAGRERLRRKKVNDESQPKVRSILDRLINREPGTEGRSLVDGLVSNLQPEGAEPVKGFQTPLGLPKDLQIFDGALGNDFIGLTESLLVDDSEPVLSWASPKFAPISSLFTRKTDERGRRTLNQDGILGLLNSKQGPFFGGTDFTGGLISAFEIDKPPKITFDPNTKSILRLLGLSELEQFETPDEEDDYEYYYADEEPLLKSDPAALPAPVDYIELEPVGPTPREFQQSANGGVTLPRDRTPIGDKNVPIASLIGKSSSCPRKPGYEPCVSQASADYRFHQCCAPFGDGCQAICNYDLTVEKLHDTVAEGRCPASRLPEVLACGAEKKDASECCRDMGVLDSGREHCAEFCNPANGLPSATDFRYAICLDQFPQIMKCFMSGLN